MISKYKIYAVIGASADPEKYGHKVLVDLDQAGYKVFAVNPKGGEIAGLKAYPDIKSLPEKPDIAIFVVPPQVALSLLPEVQASGATLVWFQPGSESKQAIDYCQKHGLQYVANACIMIERNKNDQDDISGK